MKSPSNFINNRMTNTSEMDRWGNDTFNHATVDLSTPSHSNQASKVSFIIGLNATKSNHLLKENAATLMRKRVKVMSKRPMLELAAEVAI